MTWKEEWLASLNTVWGEPEKPKRNPIECWVNVYADYLRYHTTQESAKRCADVLSETVRLVEATEAKEIWRLLEPGEVRQASDEWCYWQAAEYAGIEAFSGVYRRRVKVVEVVE